MGCARNVLVGLLALVAALLAGCTSPGNIPASMVEGTMRRVIRRHNTYVENDPGLTPLQKRTMKRDGTLLEKVLDEALKKADKPEAKPAPKVISKPVQDSPTPPNSEEF